MVDHHRNGVRSRPRSVPQPVRSASSTPVRRQPQIRRYGACSAVTGTGARAGPLLEGRQRSYLASEETFQTFRRYQLRNRIVPLVGDFGGTTALPAVGRYLSSQGAIVTAFYTSNVEVYLGDALQQFVANVTALPRDEHSMFIRTRFNTVGFARGREDYKTTTSTEPMNQHLDSWRTTDAQWDSKRE